MKTIYALTILSIFFVSACKYDNGPSISFRSKKARVEGTWIIDEQIEDGQVYTPDSFDRELHWEFKKDGTFNLQRRQSSEGSGTWDFDSKKDSVIITFNGPPAFKWSFHILKLKNKELWIKNKNSLNEIEYHLKPI